MSDVTLRTVTVACLACDAEQEITYQLDQPAQRFACVACGNNSVVSPTASITVKEPSTPKKPWAPSANDRNWLRCNGVKPE